MGSVTKIEIYLQLVISFSQFQCSFTGQYGTSLPMFNVYLFVLLGFTLS
jgi:hypothetical protein